MAGPSALDSPNARAAIGLAVVLAAGAALYFFAMSTARVIDLPTPPVEDEDGVAPPVTSAPPAARPNILLFTIDTQRADHLSAYGYARDTTPTIAALAARGTRFDRAYATSTWTVPSLASLVTGVLPSEHGVQHGLRLGSGVVDQEILAPSLPSLAESLHEAGYRTVGITANVHLASTLGFARGFDAYENLAFASVDEVRPRVSAQLEALDASHAPFFLWVHVVDPHSPYRPRAPAFDAFWPAPQPRFPTLDGLEIAELIDARIAAEHLPAEDAFGYEVAAYDSETRAVDDYLHELLGDLPEENLAVVVLADHGEELHDHLGLGHGHTGYDEVARVPLVIALPGAQARVVTDTVSLLDVFPTLAALAEAPAPARLAGRSLVPATLGEPLDARDAILETGRGPEIVQALVSGHVKYGRRVRPTPVEGLFDLDADPTEHHNLVLERPELAASLRERLDRALADASARRPETTTAPIEVDAETRARLEALGYVP